MDYSLYFEDIVKLLSYNSVVTFIILCILFIMLLFNIIKIIFR